MPKPVPGVMARSVYSDLDDYDMAVDSAGHLHLVLTGRDAQAVTASVNQLEQKGPPNSLYHLEWDGSVWSEPFSIFTPINGDLPEWPRIAVANGNQLHVVWFNRDAAHINDTEGGQYQVWYNHGTTSAPAIAPMAWPTPTPTPTALALATPTLVPTVAATPTPIAALAPDLAQLSVPPGATTVIYSDHDEVFLLAKSLLPVALVIVVVVVSVRYWRR
jgi:hypothetical protein